MLNPKTTSKNQSQSKFLGNRRKRFLNQGPILAKNLNFVKENQGSISISHMDGGTIKCYFSSYTTGRNAFAYGKTFSIAYVNMIRRFNEKYA